MKTSHKNKSRDAEPQVKRKGNDFEKNTQNIPASIYPRKKKKSTKTNLTKAMQCFHLTEEMLAAAIQVDRSIINRWKSGNRELKWNSIHAQSIAKHLLQLPYGSGQSTLLKLLEKETSFVRGNDPLDILAEWLCLPISSETMPGVARALGEISVEIEAQAPPSSFTPAAQPRDSNYKPSDSLVQMAHYIFETLRVHPDKKLLVYVPLPDGVVPVGPNYEFFWNEFAGNAASRGEVLISPGKRKSDMNALLAHWIPILSKGFVRLYSAVESETLRHTIFYIEDQPDIFCLIQPTPLSAPHCVCINHRQDAQQFHDTFIAMQAAAHPMLTMLRDAEIPQTEQIFYGEFALPGRYDILKSGINTMYLSADNFYALLLRKGIHADVATASTERFKHFQQVMCQRLREDAARELMDAYTIEAMVEMGSYPMPGVYFDMKGILEIDAQCIADICAGYVRFLREYPNLDVKLSRNAPSFFNKLCWHIKNKHHVLLQTWAGSEAISIYSENQQLIREFSRSFEKNWAEEPVSNRTEVIAQFQQWEARAHKGRTNEKTV